MASEYDRGIRAPPRPPACRDADHRINGTDDVINVTATRSMAQTQNHCHRTIPGRELCGGNESQKDNDEVLWAVIWSL